MDDDGHCEEDEYSSGTCWEAVIGVHDTDEHAKLRVTNKVSL